MNSFQRFGLTHLSASSLNLWRSAPGVWALRYVGKVKDDGGPAMWRGTAVEVGLAAWLHGLKFSEAKEAALRSFELNTEGEISDDIEAERRLIEPMLRVPTDQWRSPGPLNATQLRVECWFDQIPIPVIGYLDFAFDGIDIDLKTTKACPSAPRAEHVRQVALYRKARGRAGGLLYVTDKRHAYYEVTDEMMEPALADLEADALSLNNFLARCDSPRDVIKSLPIDYENFRAPKTKVALSDILLAG